MRPLLVLALALLAAACETQPLGARCESDLDCDRTTGADRRAVCLSISRPGTRCVGGVDCICCPVNEAARSMFPGCAATPPPPDVTEADAEDVMSVDVTEADADAEDVMSMDATTEASMPDAGLDGDAGGACVPACGPGTYCAGGACRPALSIGQRCETAAQCASGHCVDQVCCNSACTCVGCSCAVEPDFAGVCMRSPARDSGLDAPLID